MNAPYSNCSQENPRKAGTAEALFIPSFRPDPLQSRLFDAPAGVIEHAERADRAEGAGLVSYKTKQNLVIGLSENEKALRRISRLKKAVWASGHLHALAQSGFRPAQCWFVTTTYRPGVEWEKNHIKKAMQGFRDWCKSKGIPCRYTWVAELQGRGAVHYHLLAWLPVGVSMPQWDRTTRKSKGGMRPAFWPHGMTNTQKAVAGIGYLMKYLSKMGEFHRFPEGLRLYGIGGLDRDGRAVRSWLNLPAWVKPLFGVGEVLRSAGHLIVRATGEILEAAFRARVIPGGLEIFPVRTLAPVPIEFQRCGAYSSWPSS